MSCVKRYLETTGTLEPASGCPADSHAATPKRPMPINSPKRLRGGRGVIKIHYDPQGQAQSEGIILRHHPPDEVTTATSWLSSPGPTFSQWSSGFSTNTPGETPGNEDLDDSGLMQRIIQPKKGE